MCNRVVLAVVGLTLFLLACSTPPPPAAEKPKEPEKPAEPIDGQRAFFQMYVAARGWAPDAQGLLLETLHVSAVQPAAGRYGGWRATFVSLGKRRSAVFNYAVEHVSDKIPKGVFQDHEEGYSEGLAKPWPVSAFRVSSEAAFKTAMERRETREYVKKYPERPVFMVLEQTKRHPVLAWRVVWGDSVSRSDFSVFVDASTGNFLEVMR